jgi:hypothetical protein
MSAATDLCSLRCRTGTVSAAFSAQILAADTDQGFNVDGELDEYVGTKWLYRQIS